jgi:WD40 repeat protein
MHGSTLSLWDIGRKKSVCSIPEAHGAGHWIHSLAALKMSDLVASGECPLLLGTAVLLHNQPIGGGSCCAGSNDGFIRLWKVPNTFKDIIPLNKIAMVCLSSCVMR